VIGPERDRGAVALCFLQDEERRIDLGLGEQLMAAEARDQPCLQLLPEHLACAQRGGAI
jgi:hypothetical protein